MMQYLQKMLNKHRFKLTPGFYPNVIRVEVLHWF